MFEDSNANGERDEGEPPLADVWITLSSEDGSLVLEQTTDELGCYKFIDLAPGRYVLAETNPEAYPLSTTPDEVDVLIEGPMPVEIDFGDHRAG